jgi:CRP/FNR family transcriptional regulator, cyclic AMP receptor protein
MINDHLIGRVEEEFRETLHPGTGFLPSVTPLIDLPAPFDRLSDACHELAYRYHGSGKDVRPWLDSLFAEMPGTWLPALEGAPRPVLEALMTKASLLCHAYRWRFMPTDPALYHIKSLELPLALDQIWTESARILGIPRVGMFYTMVTCNWRLEGRSQGCPYETEELEDGRVRLIDAWLLPPEDSELTAFIVAALRMEAQGRRVADCMLQTYRAILREDHQEVAYRLVACRDVLKTLLDAFNGLIRKDRMDITNFLKLVQPTMLWLLDHGEGPLEGASGPQACTVQLLDNFLGVPRESELGEMILKSRRYMLPEHRRLLELTDPCQPILRDYVERLGDSHITELFNSCVGTFLTWRRSHQKRGAMYLKGKPEDKVEHYASTGLVVGVENDRVKIFESTMQRHIEQTESRVLADPWKGRERSFEAVFRYLGHEQRSRFRRAMKERPVAAGEVIIAMGQRRPGLMLMEKGEAHVRNSAGMRKLVIARIRQHEIFGEMSMLENEPAGAEVVASCDGVVAQLSLDDLYLLLRQDSTLESGLYLCLGKTLSARLRRINAVLPHLLAQERLPTRPLIRAAECGKSWRSFAVANGFHRDFWPLWLIDHDSFDGETAPKDTSLSDLSHLDRESAGNARIAQGPILHLGVGPGLGNGSLETILIEPSDQILGLWQQKSVGSMARGHHQNIIRMAQGYAFLDLPRCTEIHWDLLMGYASDAEVVDVLNWAYARLLPGGEMIGCFFTPATRDCPLVREFSVPFGVGRTEDQVTDLFTRSGWGASPVVFRSSRTGYILSFCAQR